MYGHEVIRDLQERLKFIRKNGKQAASKRFFQSGLIDEHTKGLCKNAINNIRLAKHYHIPDLSILREGSGLLGEKTSEHFLFKGEIFGNVDIFDQDFTWFDFTEETPIDKNTKSGLLIESKELNGSPFMMIVCASRVSDPLNDNKTKKWFISPILYHIILGRDFTLEEKQHLILKNYKISNGIKGNVDIHGIEEITTEEKILSRISNIYSIPIFREDPGFNEDLAREYNHQLLSILNTWMVLSRGEHLEENVPTRIVIETKKKKSKRKEIPDKRKFNYYTLSNLKDFPQIDESGGIIETEEDIDKISEEKMLQTALYHGYKTQLEKIMYFFFKDQPFHPDHLVWADDKIKERIFTPRDLDEVREESDGKIKRIPTERVLEGRLNIEIIYPTGISYEGRMRATVDGYVVLEPSKKDRCAWLVDIEDVRDLTIIDLRKIDYQKITHHKKNMEWLKGLNYINRYDY